MTHNSGPHGYGGGWAGAPQWGGMAPAAPQPGVIPLRPLALGDILGGAFQTLRRHWKAVLGVVLAVQAFVLPVMALVVGIAVAAVHQHFDPVFDPPYGEDPASEHVVPLLVAGATVFALLLVIGMLGMAVICALCPAVLKEAVTGRPTRFRPMWRASLRRAPAVAGAVFLGALTAAAPMLVVLAVWVPLVAATDSRDGASLLLVLLPVLLLIAFPLSVWLNVRFSFASAAVVLENAGPLTALRRSAALVRGDGWRILGITLVGALLAGVVAWVIQLPFNLIGTFALIPAMITQPQDGGGPSGGLIAGIVAAALLAVVGAAVSQVFQIGFGQLVSGLLYVDQRIRREGLAEAILADLAPAPAPAPAGPAPAGPPAPPQ
ncbi:hypothetical protein ACFWBI_05550 [Streptomyces sp. NPDC059982]|uniref:hypothetical protein n=1 Tax=unclassified Streptomyces TaxID=2593676 RepID=UPI0036BD67B7